MNKNRKRLIVSTISLGLLGMVSAVESNLSPIILSASTMLACIGGFAWVPSYSTAKNPIFFAITETLALASGLLLLGDGYIVLIGMLSLMGLVFLYGNLALRHS